MEMKIAREHEKHDQLAEDEFYPDHGQRTESPTFRATKKAGHAAGLRCAISGQATGVQYHHIFCEWALSGAVDWVMLRRIAIGEVTQLPVLDLETDRPTGEFFPVKESFLWAVLQLTIARGFDWHAFEPEKPETFVDSMANILVLHEKFHIGKFHGIHGKSFPVWVFHAFPRVAGFVYTPDEEAAIISKLGHHHEGDRA